MAGKHEPSAKRPERRTRKRKNKATGIIVAVIVIVVAVVVIAGIIANGTDAIFPGVSVDGVKVGGMSVEEAKDALEKGGFTAAANDAVVVRLTDDVDVSVTVDDAGLAISSEEAAQLAMNYGRESGFVGKAFSYIGCVFGGGKIDSAEKCSFDEAAVRDKIAEGAKNANATLLSSAFVIGEDSIQVTKGASGVAVDQNAVYDMIKKAFDEKNFSVMTYEPATENPDEVDLQVLYDQVYTEVVESVYDPATYSGTESTVGVSFNMQEAQAMYDAADDGEVIVIPLIKTEPKMSKAQLDEMLFRDTLSTKGTSLSTSSSNRINNVDLAAKAINGLILNPGDVFSFNGTVGERTAAKGYKLAGAYVGGENVDQLGGGICQVSSTLYYCTLMADLKTVDRANHMYPVAYLPMGLDATVNWGTIDFKFANDSDYPVRIDAVVEGKTLTVTLVGTQTSTNYVKLDNAVISSTAPETKHEIDETLAPGTTKVKTSGHTGYVVDAFKYIYDENDELVEKIYLGRNRYRVQAKVVLVAPDMANPYDHPDLFPDFDPNNPNWYPPVDPPVDDPTVDDPTVDDPTVDDPVVDTPVEDEPVVDPIIPDDGIIM